jgi:hypothetical protein
MFIPLPPDGRGGQAWATVLVALVQVLPLVLLVVLTGPAWLLWPVLPERTQGMTFRLLNRLCDWAVSTTSRQ